MHRMTETQYLHPEWAEADSQVDRLIERLSDDFLDNPVMSVPIPLVARRECEVLWVNQAASLLDPNFAAQGSDWARYEAHLTASCSYQICEKPCSDLSGWADRYGGNGIGFNGGSGRSVLLGDYNLKGVGCTPLVARQSDALHTTGQIRLDECVREAVFSEVIRRDFPWSAVPVLAILRLRHPCGEDPSELNATSPAILIRPKFLRPAHFMRADLFKPESREKQEEDVERTRSAVTMLDEAIGHASATEVFTAIHRRWAEQVAFGFVHRISHGEPTPSNVSLDGRLVDFGGSTALPSWANFVTSIEAGSADDVKKLRINIKNFTQNYNRYTERCRLPVHELMEMWVNVKRAYHSRLNYETLQIAGMSSMGAVSFLNEVPSDQIFRAIGPVISYYGREVSAWKITGTAIRKPWEFDKLWSDNPPAFLRPLRNLIEAGPFSDDLAEVMARCEFLASNRTGMFTASQANQCNLAVQERGQRSVRSVVSELIDREVSAATRSSF